MRTPLRGAQARCRPGKGTTVRKEAATGETDRKGGGQSRGSEIKGRQEDGWRKEEELGAAGGEKGRLGSTDVESGGPQAPWGREGAPVGARGDRGAKKGREKGRGRGTAELRKEGREGGR